MSNYQPQKHIDFDYQDILKYLKRVKIAVVQLAPIKEWENNENILS